MTDSVVNDLEMHKVTVRRPWGRRPKSSPFSVFSNASDTDCVREIGRVRSPEFVGAAQTVLVAEVHVLCLPPLVKAAHLDRNMTHPVQTPARPKAVLSTAQRSQWRDKKKRDTRDKLGERLQWRPPTSAHPEAERITSVEGHAQY